MITSIRNRIERFQLSATLTDERGLSTVEYIIILLLIAVFAIAAWTTFGETLQSRISESTDRIGEIQETDGQSAPSNPGGG